MRTSLETLVAGSVDYAGLFPPAALDMTAAVQNYADYRADPAREMLGRFVLPVLRLPQFEQAAAPLLSHGAGATPWQLSALTGADVTADLRLILEFNSRHWAGSDEGQAVIDTVEIRASTTAEIEGAMSRMSAGLRAFFELPLADDPAPLVSALRRSGGGAKARTGGITPEAFPSAASIARFLLRCRDAGVPCKFTAGLHHPIRGSYRLTYAPDAPRGTMYGYLNVFVAAALALAGADEDLLLAALDETDPLTFEFGTTALAYRGTTVPLDVVRRTRESLAVSFGSCSFREPADELAALSPA